MDQYIGKMLDDRYEILERIGTGGMAIVYKAKDQRLNRLIAMKILKSDLAQDADFRRRFNAESQAVAQLSHPNIVSVYDVSKGGDTQYIVMELIDGITLKHYMEKRGQLDWRESLHFITQIMRGLSHAHSRGIVHRDIKPQNVMVLRDGSVKVTDFGIACLESASQTLTQEALGSVHYISPEQARGDRTDARSDIYSAGVVLYEMLTGRLPFEGDSAVSVAIQHLSSIPLAPREVNPDIPAQLELICMKAMAPDLDRRYASAEEMIADLEAFRKNPGVDLDFNLEDVRPDEEDEPTRLLKTAHVSAAAPRRAERREPPEEYHRRPPVRKGGQIALIAAAVLLAIAVAVLLFRSIFGSFGSGGVTETYTVPTVTGYTVEAARELPDVKDIFEIEETGSKPSDTVPVGVILEQDPSAGSQTKTNMVIHVTVSSGEDTGKMIDLVNQEYQVATKILLKDLVESYGLLLVPVEENSDTINEGYITRTEPEEGATLKKGDTITIYVSSGPKDTTVPKFTGQNITEVQATLESVWFLTSGEVTERESDQDAGTILEQSIDANTTVPRGTAINFVVSSGPPPVPETKTITINPELPTDRETVVLRVDVDNETQYEREVECSAGSVPVDLTGSGSPMVSIYWDGELQTSFPQQFT